MNASAEFREAAMHGSFEAVKKYAQKANVHAVELSSGRTALHKVLKFLCYCKNFERVKVS